MNTQDIYQDLIPLFCDVLELDQVKLEAGTTAHDVSGWDSLNNIRLMMSIQRRFRIKFSAAEIGRLKNVGELVALIESKCKAAPAAALP